MGGSRFFLNSAGMESSLLSCHQIIHRHPTLSKLTPNLILKILNHSFNLQIRSCWFSHRFATDCLKFPLFHKAVNRWKRFEARGCRAVEWGPDRGVWFAIMQPVGGSQLELHHKKNFSIKRVFQIPWNWKNTDNQYIIGKSLSNWVKNSST